jgi:predicted Fe-Mo cluster-binding NifX family protein
MKICIPTLSNDGKESKVNEHFGSAPYFAIYNTDDKTLEFIENTNAHHSHGMCQPIAALSEKSIEAVVCGGMGVRALQKLSEQGIKAYKANSGTVEEIISQYEDDTIEELTVENACNQHGCH